MRRLSFLGLFLGVSSVAACSLLNAPDEVKPGGSGGGGGDTSTSSSQASSSSSSSGGAECMTNTDCPAPSDTCKIARCDAQKKCVEDSAPNNTPCDDGQFCTENDICVSGACTAGPAKVCPPSTNCKIAECREATDSCEETDMPDDTACDDGDPCTQTSACAAGVCVSGPSCKDTECTTGMCTAQGCMDVPLPVGTACGITDCSNGMCDDQGKCLIQPVNVGGTCDDGLYCTTGTTCNNLGQCAGGTKTCGDVNTCVLGTCDEVTQMCGVTVAPAGTPCDDANACTANDACNGPNCVGMPVVAGTPCDDSNVCTAGETCNPVGGMQMCGGGQPPQVIFFDNFKGGNTKGWLLGSEWQIAPAAVGTLGTQCCGFTGDPGADKSSDPFDSNFIAGIVIGSGGLATTNVHPFSYMTSPVVNTAGVPGEVHLTFWRFLNSDYPPYMFNVVDVTADGQNWTTIWQGADGIPIADGDWQFQSYNITAFKSATMRFRFGMNVNQGGAYSVGSWNIDDVKVQTAPCPN
jgi:hypothetical protein